MELTAPLVDLLGYGRIIAFNSILVEVTGSVNAALMMRQAIYWSGVTDDPEGWFYKTAKEWQAETGLTQREQTTARRALKAFMESKRAGLPAKCYYKINRMPLHRALESRLAESAKLDSTKARNLIGVTNTEKTALDDNKEKQSANASVAHVDFADDDLQAEWTAWQTYRRQAGKPLTQIGRGRQVALLSKMGVARAIAALRHSIENGWTGIFEPKNAPKPKQPWSLRERKINKLNQRKAELMRLPDSADVRRQLTQIQIQLTDL
jgi:hypothetical protein